MAFSTLLRTIRPSRRFYSVRVRFAPSPTGYLHLGGLRTALYNFLFAKKHGGSFLLRIEDTDQTRKVPGAAEALYQDLEWAGIEIHEGPHKGGAYGPYVQSERLLIYRRHLEELLQNGAAYRCFCSDRRLQLIKREAAKAQEVPKYDNRCRHLSAEEVRSKMGQPHCVRFKISDQEESFDDLVYGKISYNVSLNEGDPVIMKSDGYPTYHFANVVDDHLMQITHVLRGVEWQISTTKHLLLYRAFGWTPPRYGHLPLLLNSDGTKLSKRQGDIRIATYRDQLNVLPLALLNFIVNSGGGFQKDAEGGTVARCYTLDELSDQFDVTQINAHSGKLMPERLMEFNNLELKRRTDNPDTRRSLVTDLKTMVERRFGSVHMTDQQIEKVLVWALPRIGTLHDLLEPAFAFIWTLPESYEVVDGKAFEALKELKRDLEDDEKVVSNDKLKEISQRHGLKFAVFMKIVRHVLSGLKEGPGVAEMIDILGREDAAHRIELCLKGTEGKKHSHHTSK